MVVPVVDYTPVSTKSKAYRRNAGKYDTKPVELNLLSANRKIVNMSFILNFYQKDAVSDNRSQANYLLYFTDSNGVQISDTQKIIADKVSTDGQDRTFRCSFNLKSQAYSKTESYYLNIVEESNNSYIWEMPLNYFTDTTTQRLTNKNIVITFRKFR